MGRVAAEDEKDEAEDARDPASDRFPLAHLLRSRLLLSHSSCDLSRRHTSKPNLIFLPLLSKKMGSQRVNQVNRMKYPFFDERENELN